MCLLVVHLRQHFDMTMKLTLRNINAAAQSVWTSIVHVICSVEDASHCTGTNCTLQPHLVYINDLYLLEKKEMYIRTAILSGGGTLWFVSCEY
jgi:hypothetical protein